MVFPNLKFSTKSLMEEINHVQLRINVWNSRVSKTNGIFYIFRYIQALRHLTLYCSFPFNTHVFMQIFRVSFLFEYPTCRYVERWVWIMSKKIRKNLLY